MASRKRAPPSDAEAGLEAAQRPVLDLLLDPATHGVDREKMARVDTHIATVVLAGPHAYKLKRAVKLPFVDFSTLARREAACRAELALNRRTAPEIYLDVVPVTWAADGGLRLGGDGEPVEWLVKMRRFDDRHLLDRLAQRHALPAGLALRLAAAIAEFHQAEAPAEDGADAAEIERLIRLNSESLGRFAGRLFAPEDIATLERRSLNRLAVGRSLIAARRAAGKVRHCHGDLHLRNIFLDGERPVLFDALEFDERLARIDVLYDLAFLLMDLWHRGLTEFASALFNRYLLLTGDYGGLALLPLFLSLRAGIRAHVTARAAETQTDREARRGREAEARSYLRLATGLLVAARPHLIAVGGYSGSGKSTLARALAPCFAPVPGAVVARSDEIRKRLSGAAPEDRLPEAAYAPAMSRRVYAEMRRVNNMALTGGYTAILDAVHDRGGPRRQAARLAEAHGVGFHGFWLDAPAEVLAQRVDERQGDASDATAEVVRAQIAKGSTPASWQRLAADAGPVTVLSQAVERLAERGVNLQPI